MGKKVIPEQVTVFCDRCNKEGINIDLKIRAEKTGRDWSGEAVGGTTSNLELCTDCLIEFETFMKTDSSIPKQSK